MVTQGWLNDAVTRFSCNTVLHCVTPGTWWVLREGMPGGGMSTQMMILRSSQLAWENFFVSSKDKHYCHKVYSAGNRDTNIRRGRLASEGVKPRRKVADFSRHNWGGSGRL